MTTESTPAPQSAPTAAQLALADAIRRALTEASYAYALPIGGRDYLACAPKSEINAVIARALASIPAAA